MEGIDCDEVIEILNNNLIDLLIINLEMSLSRELELVETIRADATKDLFPIIVVNDNPDIGQKLEFLKLGVDDYMHFPFNETEMFLRSKNIIKRVSKNRDVNPLTKLSGNTEIEEQMTYEIEHGNDFAVLYCDLDNFKAYNDVYGFENGVKVIKAVADTLSETINQVGNHQDFIGHIGGDDFVIITVPERMDIIGRTVVERFSAKTKDFYNAHDLEAGYIIAKGREETERKYPLISISVAGVSSLVRRLICPSQVAEIAAVIKKKAKSMGGSLYLKDERN
jgi:diguanylate cyclase (GGDEF)-like protein